MKVAAVIVCAGKGERLGRDDKAVLKLANKPLFYHAFSKFKKIRDIKEIVLVIRKKHFGAVKKLIKDKRVRLVGGGKERKDSVYNGLCALSKDIEYVLIHDGARPFISKAVILKVLAALKNHPAVICGFTAKDTVKLVDEKGFVKKTIKREDVFLVQTPQAFRKDLIMAAYKKFYLPKAFDDAQIVELAGGKVKAVEGSMRNFKITYPEDLALAKTILRAKS